MSCPSDIDPYAVLGVQKDATLPEIKAAHRKLVLKCHPDKVKDESQRTKAQDEFQKVQQAYELLSDETARTKYDQKVRLAELKRELRERSGGAAGSSSPYSPPRGVAREYRDGRIYEERAPADPAAFFDDEIHFTEEIRPTSRKYDDFGKRPRPKTGVDEKKKPRPYAPTSSGKAAANSDRAKNRTKERKREASEKYQHYYESDGASSDSSASSIYIKLRRPSERKAHDTPSRKTKTESSRRPEVRRYDDDDYTEEYESKHDYLHTTARDYIMRSKGTVPIEVDRRPRASRSPHRHCTHESGEPEPSPSARRSRRSTRSRDSVRPSTSHNSSHEHLESQFRNYEVPEVPPLPREATTTSPKRASSLRPSLQRAATTSYVRPQRERSGPSDSVLLNMVYPESGSHMPSPSSSSKARAGMERHDSGYSSPGTEMPSGSSPPRMSWTRYKIVTEPETIVAEPGKAASPSSRHHQRNYSPVRQERPSVSVRSTPKPVRSSTTYAYTPDASTRYESSRTKSSSKPLFGEVEFSKPFKDVKYSREIGPDDIIYGPDVYSKNSYQDYGHPVGRRTSTYA